MSKVQPENIPDDLKQYAQWVNWKYEMNAKGEQTKVPYNPGTLGKAMSNNPATWGAFDEAIANISLTDGIGFVVTDNDPFTGIDFDDCINPKTGVIEDWALDKIKEISTYWEVSPSGCGIRGFCISDLPGGRRKKGPIEAYSTGRYFTLTGNTLNGSNINEHDGLNLHELLFGKQQVEKPQEQLPRNKPSGLQDDELLQKMFNAKNGVTVKRLWEGDTSSNSSHSEADMALCAYLWFWTGNKTEVDRLFRQSGLYREKWDEKHYGDGKTYGEGVLDKTCQGATYRGETPNKVDKSKEKTQEPKLRAYFPRLIDVVLQEDNSVAFLVSHEDEFVLPKVWQVGDDIVQPPEKKHLPFTIPRSSEVMKHIENSDTTLYKDVLEYLRAAAYLEEGALQLVALYPFLTELQDHPDIHYLPILLFFAVPERGKSRLGKALTYVCFRGIHLVDLREANLFRYSDNLRATLFFDCMNLWKKAERNGSEDIMLLRYEKGARVSRVIYPERGAFRDTVHYDVFGPTIIATNENVHKILDTRCVPYTMPNHPGMYKNYIPEDALELRERLTAWRAKMLNVSLPDMEPIRGITGRLWDITKPLFQVMMLAYPKGFDTLKTTVLDIAGQRLEDRKTSIEGRIAEKIVELSTEGSLEWTVKFSEVLAELNEGIPDTHKYTPQYIGKKLKAMGLKTRKSHSEVLITLDGEVMSFLDSQYLTGNESTDRKQSPKAPKSPDGLNTPSKQGDDAGDCGDNGEKAPEKAPLQTLATVASGDLGDNGAFLWDVGQDEEITEDDLT